MSNLSKLAKAVAVDFWSSCSTGHLDWHRQLHRLVKLVPAETVVFFTGSTGWHRHRLSLKAIALAVCTGSGTQAPALWRVEKKTEVATGASTLCVPQKKTTDYRKVFTYTCFYFKDFPRNSLKSRAKSQKFKGLESEKWAQKKAPISKKRAHSKSRKISKLRAPKTLRELIFAAKT